MKKIAITASLTLLLASCGSATDASEDALADNVEMPADQAMTGTPEPVADEALAEETGSEDTGSEDTGSEDTGSEEPAEETAAE